LTKVQIIWLQASGPLTMAYQDIIMVKILTLNANKAKLQVTTRP